MLEALDSLSAWKFIACSPALESIYIHGPKPRTEPGTYDMHNKNLPDE